DDLLERPVGDALAVGEAAADDDARPRLDLRDELADEPRLADPGRADHGRDEAVAGLHPRVEAAPQRGQLAPPTHHRGARAPAQAQAVGREPPDPPRAHAAG